jgi:hypothetical protein
MACTGPAHHREARRQMKRLYQVPDDFEAVIRIYSHEEGGRRTPEDRRRREHGRTRNPDAQRHRANRSVPVRPQVTTTNQTKT